MLFNLNSATHYLRFSAVAVLALAVQTMSYAHHSANSDEVIRESELPERHQSFKAFLFKFDTQFRSLSSNPASQRVALINQSQQLVREGRAEEGYQLLLSEEDQYVGMSDYDYALGITAISAGHPGQAIFAIDRVVYGQPWNLGARIDLGRAYLQMEQYEAAESEFTGLLAEDPPPQIRTIIQNYLSTAEAAMKARDENWSAYLAVGAGHDSNANGAPDLARFAGFDLDAKNREFASNYATLGGGVKYKRPLTREWAFFGSGDVSQKWHDDAPFINRNNISLSGRLVHQQKGAIHSVGASVSENRLDGDLNHRRAALEFTTVRAAASDLQVLIQAALGVMRFERPLTIQDSNSYTLATGVTKFGIGDYPGQIGGMMIFGRDFAVEVASPYGRGLKSLRLFGNFPLNRLFTATSSLSWLRSDYNGQFFGLDRADDNLSASLGLMSQNIPSKNWHSNVTLTWSENSSSIELYDFERVVMGLSLRRNFD